MERASRPHAPANKRSVRSARRDAMTSLLFMASFTFRYRLMALPRFIYHDTGPILSMLRASQSGFL